MTTDFRARAPRIVVLPHWRMEGGAGFYIQNLIAAVETVARVEIAGPYRSSYTGTNYTGTKVSSHVLDALASLVFPIYDGIALRASIYWLAASLVRIGGLLLSTRRAAGGDEPDAIIFTSSVQALGIPLAHWFFPRARIVILVQENIVLTRFLGRIMLHFLRRADAVVSITGSWSHHAEAVELKTVLLRNGYDPGFARVQNAQSDGAVSDILYVGGGGAIKGFDLFAGALPSLLARPQTKVVCLGSYAPAAIAALEDIGKGAHPTSRIDIVGQVDDVRPYLIGTSVLLLPIGSAHFCRPAIEAGFFGKTFIIPAFEGLQDFVRGGENCLTFEPGDVLDLVTQTMRLLNDEELRRALGKGNIDNSQYFVQTSEGILEKLSSAMPFLKYPKHEMDQ